MDDHRILGYFRLLEDAGWSASQSGSPESSSVWWTAHYKTPRRRIEVRIGHDHSWLLLQLPLGVRARPECRAALWRFLLHLGHELRLARYSLDRSDKVHLCVGLPADACGFPQFRDALTALRTYFEHHHREIELVAENPELAEAWLSLIPRGEPSEEPLIRLETTELDEIRQRRPGREQRRKVS